MGFSLSATWYNISQGVPTASVGRIKYTRTGLCWSARKIQLITIPNDHFCVE